MIAIEITAAVDAAGTVQTLYVSDDALVTRGTDTPANIAFLPRLIDPGSLGQSAYSDGTTGGATQLETGEIVLANIDGALDGWLDYGFDGRAVTIRTGRASADYPAGWTTVLIGTIEAIEADSEKLILRLRNKQYLLDTAVCSEVYGGTNSLPAGLDGTANDIKGQRRPRIFGQVQNISPPCVNTARLIYEVGVCGAIPAVYDRGIPLTVGTVYTSQADMETNAPAAGAFRAWPGGGYYRLGSTPAGQITADAVQGAAEADRTVAKITEQLALAVGITSGEISSDDITLLDAANPAVVGIWLQDEESALDAMDQIAASIGSGYGFDRTGVLRQWRLTPPSEDDQNLWDDVTSFDAVVSVDALTGLPQVTINEQQVVSIERRPSRDNSIPAWRYTVNYSKNCTPQADAAGSVSAERRAWLTQAFRSETAENADIKDKHLMADELVSDSLLISATAAAAESARRLDMYSVRRDIIDITVPLETLTIEMMGSVRLTYERFGCSGGKYFRLIGIRYELAANRVILTLWG